MDTLKAILLFVGLGLLWVVMAILGTAVPVVVAVWVLRWMGVL